MMALSIAHIFVRLLPVLPAAWLAAAGVNADTIDTAGQEPYEPCGYCHEYDGNATMPGFPTLAGQHKSYLVKQLRDFRVGKRNGTMQATAELLSDADIDSVASYFSTQVRRSKRLDPIPQAEMAHAQRLFRSGDQQRELPACISCHGPGAKGQGVYPSLLAQDPTYLEQQLLQFKQGKRSNDAGGLMSDVAAKLSRLEIRGLAALLARLRPGMSG